MLFKSLGISISSSVFLYIMSLERAVTLKMAADLLTSQQDTSMKSSFEAEVLTPGDLVVLSSLWLKLSSHLMEKIVSEPTNLLTGGRGCHILRGRPELASTGQTSCTEMSSVRWG